MRFEQPEKGVRGRPARGEHDFARAAPSANTHDVARSGKHIGDAARDGGRGVEPEHGPGRKLFELVEKQRVMRAAEHHNIGPRAVILGKGGRDLARDGFCVHVLAGGPSLSQRCQRRRCGKGEARASPELFDQRAGIDAGNGCGRGQHGDEAAAGESGGGFDGRHRPNDWGGETRAQRLQRNGGGGVAGQHDAIGLEFAHCRLHQRKQPRDQLRIAFGTVREASVVGDEAHMRLRHGCARGAQDRQPAEP